MAICLNTDPQVGSGDPDTYATFRFDTQTQKICHIGNKNIQEQYFHLLESAQFLPDPCFFSTYLCR